MARSFGTRVPSAGQMSHRVTIWAPEGTSDAHAGVATAIASRVPANIAALPLQFQQQERIAVGGMRGQTYYTVSMRYRSDVQPDFELREECHSQRVFQIIASIESDRHDGLEFTCVMADVRR